MFCQGTKGLCFLWCLTLHVVLFFSTYTHDRAKRHYEDFKLTSEINLYRKAQTQTQNKCVIFYDLKGSKHDLNEIVSGLRKGYFCLYRNLYLKNPP